MKVKMTIEIELADWFDKEWFEDEVLTGFKYRIC